MSKQEVVERILSDAKSEAEAMLKAAEEKSTALKSQTSARIDELKRETEKEMKAYSVSIHEKKAASARLESSKILLKEKRKVIDRVYDFALLRLVQTDKETCLSMSERLLKNYAEEGDEIFFAENFSYADEVKILPVVLERKLKISSQRLKISGGFKLVGVRSDKDLSYEALLAADRERNQAALAVEIFKNPSL